MDIKGFLKKSFEKLVGGYFYTSNLNQYNRNGLAPDYSKADLLKLYSSWAYTCASKNATAISAVPLKLYATRATGEQKARRSARMLTKSERFRLNKNPMLQKNSRYKAAEDVEEILDHPFLDLMNRVNNQRNSFETIEETSIFMDCTGDAYWNIERNMLGVPESIYLLPSQLVTIVPDEKEFIKGYLYGNNPAKRIAFEPEEIIQFRMPNPKNIYYGLSCIEAAIMAVERYKAMDEYEQSLNKNMGVPPLLIRYKTGNLTPERRKELEIEWNRLMRGVGNAGKTKVADMDWDVVPLGIEPRDMGFEVGRQWTLLEIANAFGVPLALIKTEGVPRANLDAALFQYQAFTILPRLRRIEQKLNEQLIPMYDEPRLFVAYENNVPEDREFDLKRDDIYLRNGVVTVNEVRSKDALDPVEWGDEPYQAQSQGSLITQDGNEIRLGLKKKSLEKARQPKLTVNEKKLIAELKKAWDAQSGHAQREFNFGSMRFDWLDDNQWNSSLINGVKDVLKSELATGAVTGANKIGMNATLNMWIDRPEAKQFIQNYGYKFAKDVNTTTQRVLREQMAEGVSLGEDINALKNRVKEVFEGTEREARAEMIARTESIRAQNAGSVAQWKESGVVEALEWDAAGDGCEFCLAMDGKVIDFGKDFLRNGETMEGIFGGKYSTDYERVGYPPLHPNCRCTVLPVLNEEYRKVIEGD